MIFKRTDDVPVKRTLEHFKQCGMKAITVKQSVKGIKGPTCLTKIIKLPNAVPYDYMHLIYEGIMKKLLYFWFHTSNSKKMYYICECIHNY